MSFCSVLFMDATARKAADTAKEPIFFSDLNLDQIVAAITAGRDEYDLKPFFYVSLGSVTAIEYRQAIFRDLQTGSILLHMLVFATRMRTMRGQIEIAGKAHYRWQKQRLFLGAVETYCDAVAGLARDLSLADIRSEGLQRLRGYLASYTATPDFLERMEEARRIKRELGQVEYRLHIEGTHIEVSRFESEADYGEQVVQTFEKFRQGDAEDSKFEFRDDPHMNHVEAEVLDRVALVFPETFARLDRFCSEQAGFLDDTVRSIDREMQFYVATLEMFERMKKAGLPSCLPAVSDAKDIECRGVYDLSLAICLKSEVSSMVLNDFRLKGPERILVVSGANQGGKTTFARTVGQLHYIASLGCLVAAADARLLLFDQLFTHFEREESLQTLRSKLEDDLVRIHGILERATPRSLLVMNESFSSATLQDALHLGKQVLQQIMAIDLVCVFVTFLDDLSMLGDQTVSLVSTVKDGDATQRSFRILRMPANGLAYAAAIAEKYRLNYESVKRRVAS